MTTPAPSSSQPITLRDVAHYPAPGANAPAAVRFSPDGRHVCYLYSSDGTLTRELWAYDRDTGREFRLLEPAGGGDSDATVSREEALRRERQRQLAAGVTSYAWSATGDTLLVPVRGAVVVKRGVDGEPREVAAGGCIDPRLSRDGTAVAFVRDGELYALDLTDPSAEPRRLTFDATPAGPYGDRLVTNGLAEFVAQEEMGRAAGFWWSPDGALLAFEQVDQSPVPLYLIPHPGDDPDDLEAHRYPFAGKANVRWRLGVVPAAGGQVRWLFDPEDDSYLARVDWTPDGLLLAQLQSRDQRRLDLRRIDPRTGAATTLWTEQVEPWVNLTDDLRFVRRPDTAPDAYRILWSSERSGRREVELRDRDGALLHQVTDGSVWVDRVVEVDAAGEAVFVEGWQETPLERHLFRVSLAGGAAEQLTSEPGTHLATLAPDCAAFVDSWSSVTQPPVAVLRPLDGAPAVTLQAAAPPDPRIAALALRPPRFATLTSRDGATLHGALLLPPDLPPGERAPLLVSVYGGPHAQTVTNSWAMTARMRAAYLAQQGFAVWALDNRGSARRGLRFEGALDRRMGTVEVDDQVEGVRWLAAHVPEVDTGRTGVYGWSYGGYLTLMCLAKAPEVFAAGVAGAPVTAWDGYDTHYTERYMGTPENNRDGYADGSVLTHAAGIRGRLLLVHGMIDENVHVRHTARLITALIGANVPYDLMLFPAERHSPRREEDRMYMEGRIAQFLSAVLRPESSVQSPAGTANR